VAAARKGEAFDVESGLPVSMLRAIREATSWYALAFQYADLKWPTVAATTRRTHAEALTAITTTLLTDQRGKPNDKLLRQALCRWAFNTARRDDPHRPGARTRRGTAGRCSRSSSGFDDRVMARVVRAGTGQDLLHLTARSATVCAAERVGYAE
jgi:hypothetical protein